MACRRLPTAPVHDDCGKKARDPRTKTGRRARCCGALPRFFGACPARDKGCVFALQYVTYVFFATGDWIMLDAKQLDDLAQRLAASLPKGFQVLRDDLQRSLRATLENGLDRLNLVTREEFDVQAAVLARSRVKLERLEARVAELERALAPRDGAR